MVKKILFLWIACLVHIGLFSQELPVVEKTDVHSTGRQAIYTKVVACISYAQHQ